MKLMCYNQKSCFGTEREVKKPKSRAFFKKLRHLNCKSEQTHTLHGLIRASFHYTDNNCYLYKSSLTTKIDKNFKRDVKYWRKQRVWFGSSYRPYLEIFYKHL